MKRLDRVLGYLRHETTTGLQLREMDAFRGWACLGVVLAHCLGGVVRTKAIRSEHGFVGEAYVWVLRHGWYGVDLFFFLSGFLLFIKFGKAHYESRPRPSIAGFYIRRFRRIAPAYYVNLALLSVALIFITSKYFVSPDIKDVLWHALFAHNLKPEYSITINPVFWTLSVEAQFYVVLPFIAGWFCGRRWVWGLAAVLLASALFKFLGIEFYRQVTGAPGVALTLLPANQLAWRLDQFAIGMCFANLWLYVNLSDNPGLTRFLRRYALFLTAAGVLLVLAAFKVTEHGLTDWLICSAFPALLSIGIGLVVMGVLYSAFLKKIVANPFVELMGVVSYSIYLWHVVVLRILCNLFPVFDGKKLSMNVLLIALVLPLCLMVGIASYLAFERPFLKGKTRGLPTAG